MWMEINFLLGKNGGQMPSILGCRSIVIGRQAGGQAGRQADKKLAVYKSFEIRELQF